MIIVPVSRRATRPASAGPAVLALVPVRAGQSPWSTRPACAARRLNDVAAPAAIKWSAPDLLAA